MAHFKKILFATDLSKACEKLIPYVSFFAKKFQSHLTIMTVMAESPDPLVLEHDLQTDSQLESYIKQLREGFEKSLREIAQQHFGDIQAETHLAVGIAYQEIVNYAQQNSVDLIILASSSKEGFAQKLLGSTANKVIANALCPVMTINPFKIKAN